jgi:general secretion pathway protein N
MKKKHYIVIAIVSYLLFLLMTIPAKPVTELINKNTPVQIQGVYGSIWNGQARSVNINNIRLQDTHWSLIAWKLLIGQLAADIEGDFRNSHFVAEAGSSITGTIFVNDLNTRISAKDVNELAAIPLAQLSGTFDLDIESASWQRGGLPEASGQIKWNQAAVTIAESVSLGNVTMNLGESEEQLLLADIKNQGGDIKLDGTAKLLPDAKYAVDIKLTPSASANDNIKQSLGMFAKPQGNGDFLLKNTGSLEQIGLK